MPQMPGILAVLHLTPMPQMPGILAVLHLTPMPQMPGILAESTTMESVLRRGPQKNLA